MSGEINSDDLEKEIILMEQELIFKRKLLDECREKLNGEISEHAQTRSIANKYKSENNELSTRLEVFLTGTQKLEEENKECRERLVKLQAQVDAYLTERQQLLDSSYQNQQENNTLKTELAELKEQLKGHLMVLENFKQQKSKTEGLVTEIMSKQTILNQEQSRLDAVCKEGLRFAEMLSEEAKYQAKFVNESKINQVKMENEIIRLMATLKQLKAELEYSKSERIPSENPNYLELWKSQHEEMKMRNEELQAINQKLLEELNFTKEQVEKLLLNH